VVIGTPTLSFAANLVRDLSINRKPSVGFGLPYAEPDRSRPLQSSLCMYQRRRRNAGQVDGGEGRGVPLGGRDERPPTGYRREEDVRPEPEDRDFGWEEEDPADRRRDPLR
jgi:hypothetical protein